VAALVLLLRRRGRGHPLARDLAGLPRGLAVTHIPRRVLARPGSHPGGWPYGWFFQTAVRVVGNWPLRLEKYGMAAWHRGHWVYSVDRRVSVRDGVWPPNCTVFFPGEFEGEFGCPTGWLEPGREYRDRRNWAGSGRLATFWQCWFFVARDAEGHRYKGEAVVELVGRFAGSS
jgi:hypothetical protein